MVKLVDDSVAKGARGLKFLKDLGLGVRDKSGKSSRSTTPASIRVGASADAGHSRFYPHRRSRSILPSHGRAQRAL